MSQLKPNTGVVVECRQCGIKFRAFPSQNSKYCSNACRHLGKRYAAPPPNPSGLCQCGCGRTTPIAKRGDAARGIVARQHIRFCSGHRLGQSPPRARLDDAEQQVGPNPSGQCMCGCGKPTPLAKTSKNGNILGQPIRYAPGHGPRPNSLDETKIEVNHAGICLCGCGQRTPIATRGRSKKREVKGYPLWYIPGHGNQGRRVVDLRDPDSCYVVDETTGCHNWAGTPHPHGYGQAFENGKRYRAHCWMWEKKVGPIPKGKELHHTCENKRCVNIAHLEPLTHKEHSARHQRTTTSPVVPSRSPG